MTSVLRLTVRVIPRGGADRVEDVSQSPSGDLFLTVRVKALPEAGQANAAVEKLLAEFLSLPRSHIQLTRGAKSRLKIFSITGDIAKLRVQFSQYS